jgi:hypothetical protein
MSFDEALAEIKRHAEAKRKQESYLESIHKVETMIRNNVSQEELKSWKLVEMMIRSNSKLCDINEEHVRDMLKGM